jgi:sugar phosphate isomerase/epimerase
MQNFKIGIQLYTLREQLNDDFRGCLKELAEMGYDGVEFAGMYGGRTPEQLAEELRELGLEVCGMHLPVTSIMDPEDEAYRYAKAVGCKYLITSLCGTFIDGFDEVVSNCRKAGEVAAEQGVCFAYHNHAQEFDKINGKCALDLFYEQTSAEQVKAELDTYWIKKGGEEPVAYLKKYSARLPLIHMKDMSKTDGSFAAVGTGLIDLGGVIEVARDSVAEWVIYEQDSCPTSPLECARISINNIKKLEKAVAK